jgi:hypothetical protein
MGRTGILGGDPGGLEPRRKGDIPLFDFRIEHDDGEVLAFRYAPPTPQLPYGLTFVREIIRHTFDQCPICLTPAPTSREHVPPESIGGRIRTHLCGDCNNKLGTRVEVEFLDWRDHAMRNARAGDKDVGRYRRLQRVLYRQAPDGKFLLTLDVGSDTTIPDMLNSGGKLSYTYSPPDDNRCRLAALKHAYLAACLDRREIPSTPTAEAIRAELLAARDAGSNRDVPVGDYAAGFPVMRTYKQPHGPSLSLVIFQAPGRQPEYAISLAGSVLVPWPMHDFPPILES